MQDPRQRWLLLLIKPWNKQAHGVFPLIFASSLGSERKRDWGLPWEAHWGQVLLAIRDQDEVHEDDKHVEKQQRSNQRVEDLELWRQKGARIAWTQ